jgi:hypothetical protein
MSQLYGVPQGLFIGQQSRVDELNERISSRQFPDQPLAPNFDPRPVMTKYSYFPAIDNRAKPNVPIKPYLAHSVKHNFSPATQNGPPVTYLANIDTESVLRNQTTSLQHNAPQSVYVPSTSSDLYKVDVAPSRPGPQQPHRLLFENSPVYTTSRSQSVLESNIGKDTFYNHTRNQLRNI